MQNIKLIEEKFERQGDHFLLNGEVAFYYFGGVLEAFLPDSFYPDDNLEFKDEIEPVPFIWDEGEPKFRFKVNVIKITSIFIDKYIKYLLVRKYKKEQIKFHIFPNFLLKEWKTDGTKIWDAKLKEAINYREEYFMKKTKYPTEQMKFVECYSIPLETELANIIKHKTKNVKYIPYYSRLFKSRQLLATDFKNLSEDKIKDVYVDSYKEINKNRDLYFNQSVAAITGGALAEEVTNHFWGVMFTGLE